MNNLTHTNQVVSLNLNDLEFLIEKVVRRTIHPVREFSETTRDNEVLTTKEVLSLLKISTYTLYALRESGRLRPIRIGSKMLYRRSDVMAIMDNQF